MRNPVLPLADTKCTFSEAHSSDCVNSWLHELLTAYPDEKTGCLNRPRNCRGLCDRDGLATLQSLRLSDCVTTCLACCHLCTKSNSQDRVN